ncbi:MAG: GNAT family N-acetyltransferase [Chloroflexi bacterium]|nr:GNAT family N-acetyltransferase [Chloroflexota bacterium]
MDKNITTPHGTVIIRQAKESDAQAYRELRLEALRSHPDAFSADYAVNEQRPMTFWAERMRSLGDENTMFFAVHEIDLIGMCGIFRGDSPKTRHSASIVSVHVKSGWRGLRIADELIATCIEWARQHEIKIVKLGVNAANASAIKCYERCGFTAYGTEPQAMYVHGTMYDELLMARSV